MDILLLAGTFWCTWGHGLWDVVFCFQTYNGAEGDNDVCMYHLGVPVFHEG